MVIWIIGLSGSGKSTIGRVLYTAYQKLDKAVFYLDGDVFRKQMSPDLGYSEAERLQNGWRICRFCEYLDQQGISVIASVMSNFHVHQDFNRKTYSKYFEVYLDVPVEELIERDTKNIYQSALAKQLTGVVGIDIAACPPRFPDLVIKNIAPFKKPEELANIILNKANQKISVYE